MLKGIVNGVPKDITRIAMRGKNLFDKDHANVIAASLNDPSTIAAQSGGSLVLVIDAEPDTTYTMSVMDYGSGAQSLIWRVGFSSEQVVAVGQSYRRIRNYVPTDGVFSFTTDPDTKNMLIQFSSSVFYDTLEKLMLNHGMQSGWEVRDQNGTILWGADKTLTANAGSISYRGYGLPLKGVEVEGNMTQTGTP